MTERERERREEREEKEGERQTDRGEKREKTKREGGREEKGCDGVLLAKEGESGSRGREREKERFAREDVGGRRSHGRRPVCDVEREGRDRDSITSYQVSIKGYIYQLISYLI